MQSNKEASFQFIENIESMPAGSSFCRRSDQFLGTLPEDRPSELPSSTSSACDIPQTPCATAEPLLQAEGSRTSCSPYQSSNVRPYSLHANCQRCRLPSRAVKRSYAPTSGFQTDLFTEDQKSRNGLVFWKGMTRQKRMTGLFCHSLPSLMEHICMYRTRSLDYTLLQDKSS